MKKVFLIFGTAILFIACNDKKEADGTASEKDATSTEQINYAYTPSNHPPDNWDIGDMKNVAIVLNSLKAWEEGNVDECLTAFADSVRWTADKKKKKMSKAELRDFFNEYRPNLSSVKIVMDDYESVISKDKKDEWVSMWYKEITTDKDGKTDSLYYMDDAKIENGKIVLIDSKHRRFPAE